MITFVMLNWILGILDKYTLEEWSWIATIIAGAVAVVTLKFIFREIRTKRKQENRQRSFYFIQRLYENDLFDHAQSAMTFLREEFKSQTEKWNISQQEKDIKKSITIYLNYYEELGLSYNRNILDREIIEKMMGEASIYTFNDIKWYVDRYQQEDLEEDPETPEELLTYIQWTKMNAILVRRKEKKKKINRLKKRLVQIYKGEF